MNSNNTTTSKNNPIRVLILDAHTMMREGLRAMIESRPMIQVVGETGAREEALSLTQRLHPDVILLELNLDGDLNPEIIPDLLRQVPETRIILLTGIRDSHIHHQAVQMGAMGVVLKHESGRVLLKAIEKVNAGEVWIDRAMMAQVLTRLSRGRMQEEQSPEAFKIAQLSDREREVVRLIGEGLKNKDIAERLSISEVTVRHHLTSVYNKLGVSDRLELIIFAYRFNLADLPI